MSDAGTLPTSGSPTPAAPLPPAGANGSRGIGWGLTLTMLLTAGMFGTVGGVGAAYYFALTMPVAPSVAVIDTDALLREALATNPANPKQAADQVLATTQRRVAELVASGVVVLDRSAVIDAPASRVVRADLQTTAASNGMPAASSAPRSEIMESLLKRAGGGR